MAVGSGGNVADEQPRPEQRADHLADLEQARSHLGPVVEYLSAKFPEVDRDQVAETVASTFGALSADATVVDHLPALTQHQAQEQLIAGGAVEAHPRSAADDAGSGFTPPDLSQMAPDPEGAAAGGGEAASMPWGSTTGQVPPARG